MERKEIAEKYKWNLEVIYPSDEAWETEYKAAEKEYGDYDFSASCKS